MTLLVIVTLGVILVALFLLPEKARQERRDTARDDRVRTDAARTDYPFSYRSGAHTITIHEDGFCFTGHPRTIPFDSIFYITQVLVAEDLYKWRIRYDPEAVDSALELEASTDDTEVVVKVLALKAGLDIDQP